MPTTLAELPAPPEEILADRSLCSPPEPTDPDFTEKFWLAAINKRPAELAMSHAAADVLYWHKQLSDEDPEAMAKASTIDGLLWFLEQKQEAIAGDQLWQISDDPFGRIGGLIGGALLHESFTIRKSGNVLQRVVPIPEFVDGKLSELHAGHQFDTPTDITYIGNVAKRFAHRMYHGTVRLYGTAGDEAAGWAGPTANNKRYPRPVVTIIGDAGDGVAERAHEVNLRITGNVGSGLGKDAHTLFYDEHSRGVLIRVDGAAGEEVAKRASGKVHISCGEIASLGTVEAGFEGTIEVGPHLPGRGNTLLHPSPTEIIQP